MNIKAKALVILCLFAATLLQAQPTLKLFPTYQSIGYQLALPSGYDADSNANIYVEYRKNNEAWQNAFDPTRLNINGKIEYRGSLFMLDAATRYSVRIEVLDTVPTSKKDVLLDSSFTLTDVVVAATSTIKYVSPTGSGTAYSSSQPGDLKTLITGGLSCGTTLILKGGTYDAGDMILNLTQDCSEGKPIIIMAATGETPILDAGDYTKYTWVKSSTDTLMYSATINSNLEYGALCVMDSTRLYPYPFLTTNAVFPNYPTLSNLGYDMPGFYRKANAVSIKTADGKNPNKAKMVFSKYLGCLYVVGNNKNNYLYIKGISFKHYGKGKCDKDIFNNPTSCYVSYTLSMNDCNHVIIEDCKFEFSNIPVAFNGNCNYNLAQNCSVKDGTGFWSHGAFKQTRDIYYLEPASYGRYLENFGIGFTPSTNQTIRGNVIRNNTIKGTVSGVVMGSQNSGYTITENDINGNQISNCYDGIDAVSTGTPSATINTRIWGNSIANCPVGVSLIMPSYGPYYIFRNTMALTQRKNHNNDVYFAECDNTIIPMSWSTGLKLNAGYAFPNPGSIYFMHNTLVGSGDIGFDLYLWQPTWKKLWSRNNIYYSTGKASLFFDGVKDEKQYSFDAGKDNFYNTKTSVIAIVQPVNGIANCDEYKTINTFKTGLKTTTKATDIRMGGLSIDPDFVNVNTNNFRLNKTSGLIDMGDLIHGVNMNYKNSAPDIGAYEFNGTVGIEEENFNTTSGIKVYPNPAKDLVNITSKSRMQSIEIYSMDGKLILHKNTANQTQTDISTQSLKGIYLLKIITENMEAEVVKLGVVR
ncbi:MAG: T9SS type A sorting domain-containing protein [Bacteroidetes bacterium]|nr:T9SS type A sorting domain-containing protein [Bacteroidota bacterium]